MRSPAILLSAGALLISACANQYVLNVDTVPTGATIRQVGVAGASAAPTPISYNYPDPKFRDPTTKCFMVKGFHATWQSGATATSQDPLQLCGEGGTWTLTLNRPSGYPGLETDLMVERRILLERRAERGAAARAAGFESLGGGHGWRPGDAIEDRSDWWKY